MKTVKLGEVIKSAQPGFACGQTDDDGIFQFRMNNISNSSNISLENKRRVPVNAVKDLNRFALRIGDVLFNATNSPSNVGKSVVFPGVSEEAVYSNHFIRLDADSNRLDPSFLWRWLQFNYQYGLFEVKCRQWVNQATFDRKQLLSMDIPLPPLLEQRRIAAILDQADAIRAKRRRMLEHLDSLTQSIFHEMFGDVRRNSRGWPRVTIEDLAERITDGEHKTPCRSSFGIPLLSARNVRDGWIDFKNVDFIDADEYEKLSLRITPREGDVLISCSGTIGRVARVRERTQFAMVRSAALVRPKEKVLPIFVENLLSSASLGAIMQNSAKSSAQANLFQNQIKRLPAFLPPLQVQKTFADRIAQVEVHRTQVQQSLAADDELFASLQYRAFRGEL